MKLQAIDKSITATIAQEAKAQNYNLVLSKSSVLYGGDDITASIAKNVKENINFANLRNQFCGTLEFGHSK